MTAYARLAVAIPYLEEKGMNALAQTAKDAAAEIQRLQSLLHMPLTSAELKLVDKHCDWVAFKHAWNAIVKHRLEAANEQPRERAMQELADQAQALDFGYGQPAK